MKENLLELLRKYIPGNREEEICAKQFLAFVEEQKRPCDRTQEVGHVTASAWLLNPNKTAALLTYHAKLNRWIQLGGHCEEEDADILSAAIREAREESGIEEIEPVQSEIFDIDIHLIPETRKEKAHFHYDVRFLLRANREETHLTSESKQLLWVQTELPTNEPSVLRMFLKWKRLSAS